MLSRLLLRSTSMVVIVFIAFTCRAQQPGLGYVFPPVVQAGQVTEVQVGGYDLTTDLQVFAHHTSVKLTGDSKSLSDFFIPEPPYWFGEKGGLPALSIPREFAAKIEVPPKTPPGFVRLQVANANGASGTAVFRISPHPQTIEQRYRDEPQTLEKIPIGVAGRLSKIAEVDRYTFTSPRAQLVTIDLRARRIGTNMNGVLKIRDQNGEVVVDLADTEGRDLTTSFWAQAKMTYEIRLHDVDFRGHRSFVYQLEITTGPRVIATLPTAAPAGVTSDVTFVGIGFDKNSAALSTITMPVRGLRAESVNVAVASPGGRVNHVLPLTNDPVVSSPLDHGLLPIPCTITDTLPSTDSVRRSFLAAQGQSWYIAARGRSIGTDVDPMIEILDPSGQQIAANDDLPSSEDAGVEFTAKTTGVFTCIVSDASGRATDASSVVQLTIEHQPRDFIMRMPQTASAVLGATGSIRVNVERRAGFDDVIELGVTGLPAGVTVEGTPQVAARGKSGTITLNVAADAVVAAHKIQVTGSAKIRDAVVTRIATAESSGNLYPRGDVETFVDFALLAITMKPSFKVQVTDKNRQRAVHRGTTYPAPFVIARDDGFNGEVRLQMAAKQARHRQGIRGPVVTVPPNVSSVAYPCFMPEWLETDRTSRMVVIGVAAVPDSQGNVRQVSAAADARVTMILEGALLKLAHDADELTITPGESFDIPIRLSRAVKLTEDVVVELVPPLELAEFITAAPVKLAADETTATFKINTVAAKELTGRWPLQLRATAMQDAKWPVVSQTEVTIEFAKVVAAVSPK